MVEEVDKIVRWRGIVIGVSDVIYATAGICIVRALDVSAALVGRGRTSIEVSYRGAVGFTAVGDLVETAICHKAREFHKVVDCVINSFDAVRIVDGKLRIVGSLNCFVDDTIDDAQGIHC